jgi:hypothetical protein
MSDGRKFALSPGSPLGAATRELHHLHRLLLAEEPAIRRLVGPDNALYQLVAATLANPTLPSHKNGWTAVMRWKSTGQTDVERPNRRTIPLPDNPPHGCGCTPWEGWGPPGCNSGFETSRRRH